MRRSAAPSQRKDSPKLEFSTLSSKLGIVNSSSKISAPNKRPFSDELKEKDSFEELNAECSEIFVNSSLSRSIVKTPAISVNESPKSVSNELQFSAVWTKVSSRKHKVWEGDCTVTVIDNKRTVVMDMDGKILASTNKTFYKSNDIADVESGYRFIAGGKEFEIVKNLVNNDQRETCTATAFPEVAMKTEKDQKSTAPSIHVGIKRKRVAQVADENCLILPRPSSSYISKYNVNDEPITDVFVDGNLTRKLRSHQKEGVSFLYECVAGFKNFDGFGAILADEMGLGKTLQCIACLWTLHKLGPFAGRPLVKRSLIVVPSSLVLNWVAEFKKWLGIEHVKVLPVQKSGDVKTFLLNPRYSVLVISYDLAVRCKEDLERIDFDLLVCDEGHRLKNRNVKVANILTCLNIQRRILLSGTPIQNDLNELYTLADFVNPGIFGARADFRRNFEEDIVKSQQKSADETEKLLGQNKAQELNALMSQFLLRRTADLNEKYLPPKIEYVLFCKPSEIQIALYEKLLDSIFFNDRISTECSNSSFSTDHLTCIDALKKLCNHPCLLYNSQMTKSSTAEDNQLLSAFPRDYNVNITRLGDSGKLLVLFELLSYVRENFPTEKVVIVSNFTSTLDLIGTLCSNIGYKYLRLDGSTINSSRLKLVKQFNCYDDNTFLFLLSSKAGGVGLNLIGANRIILYDVDWNPANDLQAMARVWRDGQKRVCHIYRLLTTGTIEEKIYQRQIKKQSLSGAIVDIETAENSFAASESVRFSSEELKDIFALHLDTSCQTHDLMKCNCNGEKPAFDRFIEIDTNCDEEEQCQFGMDVSVLEQKKGRPCMSRLLEWEHRSGDNLSTELPEDSCLNNCEKFLTFAFYMFYSSKRIEG